MPSRHTEVLNQIIQTLDISEPHVLARLENHFREAIMIPSSPPALHTVKKEVYECRPI